MGADRTDPETDDTSKRRRRSADPRRQQDPERTRRALLAAAAEEFSQHGYDGARVARIAAAAGVGHQLITYHFGGKRGLYQTLNEQWLDRNDELAGASEPLADVIRQYVRWVHDDEAWARTLVRETLGGGFPTSDERAGRLGAIVEQARLRQQHGEIRADIDVGMLSLVLLAACIAPAVLPAVAEAFVGADPRSAVFRERYADQLARIVNALGPAERARRTTRR